MSIICGDCGKIIDIWGCCDCKTQPFSHIDKEAEAKFLRYKQEQIEHDIAMGRFDEE